MSGSSIEQLVDVMLRTGREIREGARGADRFSPYTALRLEALDFVARTGSPTMRDIADSFGITPPSATALVAGLVRSGALVRAEDPQDRRVTRVRITPAGRKALAAGTAQVRRHLGTVFANLSAAERDALARIFTKLSRIYAHD